MRLRWRRGHRQPRAELVERGVQLPGAQGTRPDTFLHKGIDDAFGRRGGRRPNRVAIPQPRYRIGDIQSHDQVGFASAGRRPVGQQGAVERRVSAAAAHPMPRIDHIDAGQVQRAGLIEHPHQQFERHRIGGQRHRRPA